MKKIYFAGSIRGGRADADVYARLIAHMKAHHTVLTEHIGCPTVTTTIEKDMTDADIYAQDTAWLRESDIVIAECSTASLGVGYEMAYAEALGKPVHIFFRKDRGVLSAMLSGDPFFHVHYYESEQELMAMVDLVLEEA